MKYYIDGSNIGRLVKEKEDVILLEIVLYLCHHIILQGDDFICYFDANAKYILEDDKKPIYDLIIKSKRFKPAPPRNQADIYILDDATDEVKSGKQVKIISNDLYRDFLDPQHPKYKSEYARFSWVDPLKGTHHSGNIAYNNNSLILKILSLNFKIPVEKDVNKIISTLISDISSTSKENNTPQTGNKDIKNQSSNVENQKPSERKLVYQTPIYDRQKYNIGNNSKTYKRLAKILVAIIFFIFLILYYSDKKTVNEQSINQNNAPAENHSNYSTHSINHEEVKSNSEIKLNEDLSQEQETNSALKICNNCEGAGTTLISESYQCSSCNGSGKKQYYNCDPTPCPNCKSRGLDLCANCNGNGYNQCGNCKGYGYIQYYSLQEKCGTCNGNGKYKCSNCNGNGHFSCSNCKGIGTVSNSNKANELCNYCYGKGELIISKQVTCTTCNGKGSL